MPFADRELALLLPLMHLGIQTGRRPEEELEDKRCHRQPRDFMISKTKLLVVALLGVIVAFVLAKAGMFPSDLVAPKDRVPAPAWDLKDLEGNTIKSSDFKGKVIVLDFWATWCPPCRAELPTFVDLQKQYGSDKLVMIGISVDQGGGEVVKPFAQQNGLNYRILLADEKTVAAFGGIAAIPTTFVIDGDGRIASKHVGLTSEREFNAEVKSLLGL